ncbi:MAG TPA: T9SS type A sorting domain-containing protein, partial [Rhodothermales bacterium]
ALSARAQSDAAWHDYFPLEIGNVWQFHYESSNNGFFRTMPDIEWRVAEERIVSDTLFYVIQYTCEDPSEGGACVGGNGELLVTYDDSFRTVMLRGADPRVCYGSIVGDAFPLDVSSDTLVASTCGEYPAYRFDQFSGEVEIGGESHSVGGFHVSVESVIPQGYQFARGIGPLSWGGCEGSCWEHTLTYARIGDRTYGTYRRIPAGLHLTSTSPQSGALGVDTDSVSFTFSMSLDTSAPPAFLIRPSSADTSSVRFRDLGRTLVMDASHEPNRDYTWIISGANGNGEISLLYPQILRYTIAPAWGQRTVSGSANAIVLASGAGSAPNPGEIIVALLTRPSSTDPTELADLTSEDIAAATTVDDDWRFLIERVRPGTYWPVALVDQDHDGDADIVGSNGSLRPIEVGAQDIEGLELQIVVGGATEQPERASSLSLSTPYPNPASGPVHLTLTLDHPAATTAEVFDVLGRRVQVLYQQKPLPRGSHAIAWDTIGYTAGIYFLRVRTEQGARTTAVVVH